MVYLVSYDLRRRRRDYKGLIDELQNSRGWWHYLDSTWLISTQESVEQLAARLTPHFDNNDSLLVIEVRRNYQGLLPKEAWDWIDQNSLY